MATTVAATMATIAPVSNASSLSSSASFGSPVVSVAPPRSAGKRSVVIRAALPESGKTARREMLASLMAAGAVIATAGQSFAASGPGTSGAQRTNEKANDLLKAADKLTTDESPPRFGPGRGVGADDTSRLAQKGGAGAIEELQGAGGGAIEGAKSAVAKAKTRIDGIFGRKTSGDISDASNVLGEAAGKVKSDIGATQGKVQSNIGTAKGKVKSDIGSVQGKVKSDAGTGSDFIADAQKNIEGAAGGVVDAIKDVLPQ